jgi:hypothetical protein
MKRLCREIPAGRNERLAWDELVRHIKIVTDPDKVAQLNAELEGRRAKEREDSAACRSHLGHRRSKAR